MRYKQLLKADRVIVLHHLWNSQIDANLDFINNALDTGARAGIELTLDSAKALRDALDRAIAAADFEEAEVRGKGAPELVRAA